MAAPAAVDDASTHGVASLMAEFVFMVIVTVIIIKFLMYALRTQ